MDMGSGEESDPACHNSTIAFIIMSSPIVGVAARRFTTGPAQGESETVRCNIATHLYIFTLIVLRSQLQFAVIGYLLRVLVPRAGLHCLRLLYIALPLVR